MKSTDIKNHKTSISQTHNLEVPGFFPTVRGSPFGQQISSPGWSTLLLQRLTLRRRPLFLVYGYFICFTPFEIFELYIIHLFEIFVKLH